jgi:hypothetical protein
VVVLLCAPYARLIPSVGTYPRLRRLTLVLLVLLQVFALTYASEQQHVLGSDKKGEASTEPDTGADTDIVKGATHGWTPYQNGMHCNAPMMTQCETRD